MKSLLSIAALALVGVCAFCLAAPGTGEASPQCTADVLADGGLLYAQVFEAKPIQRKIPHVKAILPKRTMGAKMYLHAEKGTTGEYLHRAAVCHMKAETPAYEHDPLRVDGIQSLRVYSAGGAFVISLMGKDHKIGKEIWKRAQILSTEVDIASTDRSASDGL